MCIIDLSVRTGLIALERNTCQTYLTAKKNVLTGNRPLERDVCQ